MALDLAFLAAGLVCLYLGAEWLVRGAAGLARVLGVSGLVVGLTVVAYGTSMPELVVSALAAVEGKADIALGNVIGSNIVNLGLILGVTALISPPPVDRLLVRRDVPVLLVSALALPVVLLDDRISRLEGLALLAGAVLFTIAAVVLGRPAAGAAGARTAAPPDATRGSAAQALGPAPATTAPAAAPAGEDERPAPVPTLLGLTALGLGLLVGGGKIFVEGAVGLATALGMSERVVGLTVVAIGTSLPELATSLVAALRGHAGIAVGNVVGSNIFNVLFVLGAASALSPIAGSLDALAGDVGALGAITLVGALALVRGARVSRAEGLLLVAGYAAYLAWLVGG